MAVTAPSGYPVKILSVEGVDNDVVRLLCTSCRLLTKDAVQGRCGHRFCNDCAQYLLRYTVDDEETVQCPGCFDEGVEEVVLSKSTVFPDAACRRELNRTSVKCVYGSCSWTGLYKDFEKHCQTCLEFPMDCQICGTQVSRAQLETHCTTHRNLSQQTKPGNLCPFGCEIKVDDRGLQAHVTSLMAIHLQTIHDRLNALQTAVVTHGRNIPSDSVVTGDKYSQRQQQSIARLDSSLSTASAAISSTSKTIDGATAVGGSSSCDDIANQLTELEHVLIVLNCDVARLSERLNKESTNNCQPQMTASLAKISAIERTIAARDFTIVDLESRIATLEQTSHDGSFVWKIGNVSRQRQEAFSGSTARSITSPPFYTSHIGYKMHVRVYLAGDGPGRSTHLSVYFVVARGNFDALLPWPFRQRVTLTLLDQVTGHGRGHVTDSFRPDGGPSYQRPLQEATNKAVGCPKFAPLTALEGSSGVFVRDDCMFIKVSIDLDGLR